MTMTEDNKQEDTALNEKQKTKGGGCVSCLSIINTLILLLLFIAFLVLTSKSGFFDKYAKSEIALDANPSYEENEEYKEEAQIDSEWVTPHISQQAKIHILYGDETGGAHFHTVTTPCKSLFPKSWGPDKIIQVTEKIAANDNLEWAQFKSGKMYAQDLEEGILVRVVMDAEREFVITSYPLNADRNPCPNDNINDDMNEYKEGGAKATDDDEDSALHNLLKGVEIKTKKQHEYNN